MSDTVTVEMTVRFKPFNVPNYATVEVAPIPRQEGMKELPSIPVETLEADVLDALAQRWLDQLYAKCKRRSPFRLPPKAMAA